jgi:tRNA threonylcarbamoyladenosine biosynthesis protein TsaB
VITLALDAATYLGTAALLDAGRLVASAAVTMRRSDRETLMPAVAELLSSARTDARAIGRIVCGAGPGSFTSLRIAASIAKGMAMGLGCPLFAVPSFALLAAHEALPSGRVLVALDALRGEHYVALYERSSDGTVAEAFPARLVRSDEVQTLASAHAALLVGPGQAIDIAPHAAGVVGCESLIEVGGPVDLVSWEPEYGRKAEAQVKWEAAHGRPLTAG